MEDDPGLLFYGGVVFLGAVIVVLILVAMRWNGV